MLGYAYDENGFLSDAEWMSPGRMVSRTAWVRLFTASRLKMG